MPAGTIRSATLSEDTIVNRFFRSAFFPLIVIVLLVWLASQTLIPKSEQTREA